MPRYLSGIIKSLYDSTMIDEDCTLCFNVKNFADKVFQRTTQGDERTNVYVFSIKIIGELYNTTNKPTTIFRHRFMIIKDKDGKFYLADSYAGVHYFNVRKNPLDINDISEIYDLLIKRDNESYNEFGLWLTLFFNDDDDTDWEEGIEELYQNHEYVQPYTKNMFYLPDDMDMSSIRTKIERNDYYFPIF